ncbi:hypothetical protein F4779DRAFT_643090 [Xylariaceae sp. FL0662B]|nr:hypothetical protein F4779DRAFT_643090 [Xylariaceae sp. FL0662B]
MLSLKKLFFLAATLATCAHAVPAAVPEEMSLSSRGSAEDSTMNVAEVRMADREVTGSKDVDKRNPRKGRMTVQWSRQGRFVFLLGADFPQAVVHSFYGTGEGSPAKALLQNFLDWFTKQHDAGRIGFQEFVQLTDAPTMGALYGKGTALAADSDFGFGFQLDPARMNVFLNAQNMANTIKDWASQSNGRVDLIERANDFIDLSLLGAGAERPTKRSRDNKCPANTDLLKYGTKSVSTDPNLNKSLRFAGKCSK